MNFALGYLAGAHRARTALTTQQLKLGLGSSDEPGPTLVENRDQVDIKCYHPQKRRRCLRHGDECPMSDSCTDSGRIRP